MSTQQRRDLSHPPIGDPPLDHDETAEYPPPETPEPTKTASERTPRPPGTPVETDGLDMPIADANMRRHAPDHSGPESATDET